MAIGLNSFARALLRAAGFAYPFVSGYGRIASLPGHVRLMHELPEQICVRLRCGAELYVLRDDLIGRACYYFGDLDGKVSEIMTRLLRPGDTFVDIGANVGLLTVQGARRVGPTGKVIAFEPQGELAAMLERSLALNRIDWVRVEHYGLGATGRRARFNIPAGNLGGASEARNTAEGRQIEVEIREGSSAWAKLAITRPRLVKIDVEGAEMEILRALSGRLREEPAEFLLCETNDPGERHWQQPITELLAELGYRSFGIAQSVLGVRLVAIDMSRKNPISGHDIVAAHHGQDLAPLRRFIVG